MERPSPPLTPEILLEESRFILRTLHRDDLFGKKVRLSEAEKVLERSLSLPFGDYLTFLERNGYARVDHGARQLELAEAGVLAATRDDPELAGKLSHFFAEKLESRRPSPIASFGHTLQSIEGDEILDRRYRRGATLGQGPIGVVFTGEHLGVGRPVAIKEARSVFRTAAHLRRSEIVERLAAAASAQARVVHPNVAPIFDRGFDREFPYVVGELLPGGNLRQRLQAAERGRFSLTVAVRVLLQICHGLRQAHAKGVLHLGLRPENVLFDAQGNVRLTDFGLAAVLGRGQEGAPGAMLVPPGSVGYLSPERIAPDAAPDAGGRQADIYAAGMMAYEMLTGKLPARRSPLPSQARKEVPAAFDDVFDKMTKDAVDERYGSFDDVLAALYKALPSKEIFAEGTVVLWADDPAPLPEAARRGRGDEGVTGRLEVHEALESSRPSRRPAPATEG